MEYTFNMTPVASAASQSALAMTAPLFASVDGRAAALSNEECVFQARADGHLHVMTHQVLQAMDHCREFRTLDEHVARITSILPGLGGQSDAVRKVLNFLVDRSLMVSDEWFLQELQSDRASSSADLEAIVIRACDRPQQLQRLLRSLDAHAEQRGRRDRIVVIDDSRDEASLQAHRSALSEVAGRNLPDAVHIDADAARSLLQRLREACPSAAEQLDSMASPSTGFGGGRSFNLALLLSAGKRLALLDDDYVLPFHRASGARDGMESNPALSFESRFQSGLEQSLDTGKELEEDGFALQQALLGNQLGSLLNRQGGLVLDRNGLRGRSLGRLAHLRRDARVLATFTGTRGASFTSDSLWLYRLSGVSRENFWESREAYLNNIHAEAMEFAPSQVTVRPFGLFTPFLLDNSQLLPCTANSGRGEDGLFGISANYLYPSAVTLHLPITIGHVQERRRGRFERALQPVTPGVNRFLREWILNKAQPAHSEAAPDRMSFLAAQLEDLANAPQGERIDMLEEYLRYIRADLIEHLQQQLMSSSQAPVYWVADVRRIVEVNGEALLANAPPRMDEWPEQIDARACADRLRDACRNLASQYRVWPALWRAAAGLDDRLNQGRSN